MDGKEQQQQQAPADASRTRRPYEAPQLRAVELLPEETLGFGCKTAPEVPCQSGFGFGS
jgi:hypothetical protein